MNQNKIFRKNFGLQFGVAIEKIFLHYLWMIVKHLSKHLRLDNQIELFALVLQMIAVGDVLFEWLKC